MAQYVSSARAPFKYKRKLESAKFTENENFSLRQSFPESAEWEDDLTLEMLMLDG